MHRTFAEVPHGRQFIHYGIVYQKLLELSTDRDTYNCVDSNSGEPSWF